MHRPLYVNEHEAKRKRGKGGQMHKELNARKGKPRQRKSCRMISLNITDARDSYLLWKTKHTISKYWEITFFTSITVLYNICATGSTLWIIKFLCICNCKVPLYMALWPLEVLNRGRCKTLLRHFHCHYESHFFAVHQSHFRLAFTHFQSAHRYDCCNYRSKCPQSHGNFFWEN